jgi:THO complex subunit 2
MSVIATEVEKQIAARRRKINTSLKFRQVKFNLLREESEGYSKLGLTLIILAIELTENLPQPLDVYWASQKCRTLTHEQINEQRRTNLLKTAKNVMKILTCLIGCYNLAPMRVLDIILDIFISMLADNWDFFIELLLLSPWKPIIIKNSDNNASRPNEVVGQILGFKFRPYDRETPRGLLLISALLVMHKIVDLDYLYTHLGPDDEKVKQICLEYLNMLSGSENTGGELKRKKV